MADKNTIDELREAGYRDAADHLAKLSITTPPGAPASEAGLTVRDGVREQPGRAGIPLMDAAWVSNEDARRAEGEAMIAEMRAKGIIRDAA